MDFITPFAFSNSPLLFFPSTQRISAKSNLFMNVVEQRKNTLARAIKNSHTEYGASDIRVWGTTNALIKQHLIASVSLLKNAECT